MKKVKQIIGTTLTASLATGVTGTIAGTIASAATIDEIYKAAYEATINALANKDQDSINAARVAISKLPSEFQAFIGEFSKQVDTVQHPILVKIVDSINNADRTGKQVDINAARMTMPAGLPDVWRNSYSSGLDAVQQKLIVKAVTAAEAAKASGAKADIDAAKALINEIALVENNQGVKDWITTYDKDFTSSVPLTVDKVEATANDTLKVSFLKAVDASSVKTGAFSAYATDNKTSVAITSATLSEDKMSVTLKLGETVTEGKGYTLDVKDLKDTDGNTMKSSSAAFEYAKAEIASVTITKQTIKVSEDLRKSVVVKDSLGRDITKDTTITFESSNTGAITTSGIAKANGQVVVTPVIKDSDGNIILRGDKTTVTVAAVSATDYQGYSVYKLETGQVDNDRLGSGYTNFDRSVDLKYKDSVKSKIAFFFKDQFGNEMNAKDTNTFEVLENLTPLVATLDSTHEITANGVGTAYFKVKVQDVTKTISVNVTAEAVPTAMTLDKSTILVGKSGVTQDITATVKDQYGLAFGGGTPSVRFQVQDAQGNFVDTTDASVTKYATVAATAVNGDGESTITVTPGATLGKNTYRVIYENKDSGGKVLQTLTKDFTTEVKDAGTTVNSYEAKAVNTLDLYNNPTTIGDDTKSTFGVYSLDTNGIRMALVHDATLKVTDSTGKDVSTNFTLTEGVDGGGAKTGIYTLAVKPGTTGEDRVTETGTYKVEIKTADGYVANNYTLTVTDSMRTAQAVTFNSTALTNTDYTANALKNIVSVTDQFGKGIVLAGADKVEVSESAVVKDVAGVSKEIIVNKVKVTFLGADKDKQKDAEITLPTPVVITIAY